MNSSENQSPFEQLKMLGKERMQELKVLTNDLLKYISLKDLATLFFPPALGYNILEGKLSGTAFKEDGFDIDAFDEEMVVSVLNMAKWWSEHYFTTSISGMEKIPADRNVLFVGNHSAGLMPIDALFAINKYRETVADSKRIYPLVHDFAYMAPRIAKLSKRMGILRASNENATDALNSGNHVLVYPGGDHDAFRTFSERKKIVLAGRQGFIKLALNAGVPIVPMVSVGLHEAFFVFSKGEKLAKKIGMKNLFRTDILPLSFSFPWGIVPAFFPYLPLPCSIDLTFCDPIYPDKNDLVDNIYDKVQDTMQKKMDDLYKNRTPLLGRK
ncbi:MAG: acyltransferase family protein [Deltaproteobacteria bacterium]|nr:acyltransferase family protein [Deltaproteobacteria bacterium]